jgi:hypothetical protein
LLLTQQKNESDRGFARRSILILQATHASQNDFVFAVTAE